MATGDLGDTAKVGSALVGVCAETKRRREQHAIEIQAKFVVRARWIGAGEIRAEGHELISINSGSGYSQNRSVHEWRQGE